MSIIKHFSTIKYIMTIYVTGHQCTANLKVISALKPSLASHRIHLPNLLIQLASSKSNLDYVYMWNTKAFSKWDLCLLNTVNFKKCMSHWTLWNLMLFSDFCMNFEYVAESRNCPLSDFPASHSNPLLCTSPRRLGSIGFVVRVETHFTKYQLVLSIY